MVSKIRKIIIGVLLGVPIFLNCHRAQEMFLQGNRSYVQGACNDALASYRAIPNKGRSVWFNMGNCYYKLGNYAQAIACWKRADRGSFCAEHDDIVSNVCATYEKLGKKASHFWLYDMLARLLTYIPVLVLQLLFIGSWYVLLLLLFCCRRTWRFYIGAMLSCCAVLLLGAMLLVHYYAYWYERGVVVEDSVLLFSGPHVRYHKLGEVSLADEVFIHDKRPGWYKVAKQDLQGWTSVQGIEII